MALRETANPRLGRGLASLLGDREPTQGAGAASRTIPIELLEPGPHQPRGPVTGESLADLVASIKVQGILQPLLARPHPTVTGRFEIIAGERRWRAAQAAGLHDVPVLVRPMSDVEASASALVENLQRQDLNAIEEGQGYRRLIDEFGMTQDALASAVSKSRSHVANTLRLLNLPPSVRNEVEKGALSAGHARALLAHPDPEKAALSVIAGGLSVRQTEAMVQRLTSPSENVPSHDKDPDLLAVERQLTDRLGLKVDIVPSGKGGTCRIRYQNADQLDGLIALLAAR